jgi:SAM-dependent methyltransferase
MKNSKNCKICNSEATLIFERGWNASPHTFPYYRCTNRKCNFLFTDYIDNWSEDQLSSLYEGHICGSGETRGELTLDKVNLAQLVLPHPNKILDFGCGDGSGVLLLREHGFEAYGHDIVPPNVGKEYITTGVRELVTDAYDIVTAIEVLEHLTDPIDTCLWIASRVKIGGIFAFSTYTYNPKKHDINWFYLDTIGHISLHTRASLQLLAEAAGFQVIADIFSTHIWIRSDSVPFGAVARIKAKHLLKKVIDIRSYQTLWSQIEVMNKNKAREKS